MKLPYFLGILGCTAAVATSCIDNNYDLSNINTTTEIKVNDLVLPINLDPVILSDIISVDNDDNLKPVTLNGKTFYAVERQDNFHSDPVHINNFIGEPDPLNSSVASFSNDSPNVGSDSRKLYLLIDKVPNELKYHADDIDGSVKDLTYFGFKPAWFKIILSTSSLSSDITSQIENLELLIPEGLSVINITAPGYTFKASDYDKSTGKVLLPSFNLVDNAATIAIQAVALDVDSKDYTYNPSKNCGEFKFDSEFTIVDGTLILSGSASSLSSISQIDYDVNYQLDKLDVTEVLGTIEYKIDGNGLNIDPIYLDNLPKFLESDETNLVLANPQIYLSLDNPVGEYGLPYQSGLDIIASRQGDDDNSFDLDRPIVVPKDATGPFNYLLAPQPDAVKDIPEQYSEDLVLYPYTNLDKVLSGTGLPSSLDINLVNPHIPATKLSKPFPVGTDLKEITGSYLFLAPLALTGDSKIVYYNKSDDWWSEDLEALTITDLFITAVASNDIPMDAVLSIQPIDKNGNLINCEIEKAYLFAKEQNKAISLHIKGNIQNLDGVIITADINPDGTEEVLTPEQYITLEDLKAKVNGVYTKEL